MKNNTVTAAAAAPDDQAQLTIIASTAPLSKRFHLDENGEFVSSAGGQLWSGTAQSHRISSLAELGELLDVIASDTELQPKTAFLYGVMEGGLQNAHVVTRAAYQELADRIGVITRTRDHFEWPQGPGLMMFDRDRQPGESIPTESDCGEELLHHLELAIPTFSKIPVLWWASASSLIFNKHTGEQLKGLSGERLWIMVKDARDIERAGKVIAKRLWLGGLGKIVIGAAGQMLERTLVDTAVWSPERFDFVSGAICEAPLEQRRGQPVVYEVEGVGEIVDTRKVFPDLTDAEEEEYGRLVDDAKAKANPDALRAEKAAVERQAKEIAESNPSAETLERAKKTIRQARDGGVLGRDLVVHVRKKGRIEAVTVAEIIADRREYHGLVTLDPLEPGYRDHKEVGKLFANSEGVWLHSMAHGGATYFLEGSEHEIFSAVVVRLAEKMKDVWGKEKFDEMMKRQADRAAAADAEAAKASKRYITYAAHRASDAIDKTFEYLRDHPDFFGFGDHVAKVYDGEVRAFTDDDTLRYEIGREVIYESPKQRKDGTWEAIPIKAPAEIARTVVKSGKRARLRPLKAVVDVPTLRRDGSLLSEPGYDPASELFYAPACEPPYVPDFPTREEVASALETLFHPFTEFSYVSPADRGVLLALALTAVIRTSLPTAPSFLLEAPDKGAGKTLLATMAAALCGKKNPDAVMTGMPQEVELEKRIAAALLVGERAMIIDNIMGSIKGATLASLLTSSTFSGRRLQQSEQLELPNGMLVLFSGNNVDVSEDLVRRVYTCRIDPGREKPELRTFDLADPLGFVKAHRSAMVAAALTLIRGRLTLAPAVIGGPVGSFEDWAKLVRDTVLWVGKEFDTAFGDPLETVERKRSDDPERDALRAGLAGLRAIFGDAEFTATEAFDTIWRRTGLCLGRDRKDEKSLSIDGSTLEACRTAWEAITGETPKSARVLGSFWSHRKDRHVNGLVLRRCGVSSTNTAFWRVEEVSK